MNKLAPLPISPSEFIFDFKSTPNFAFQTCAHFSTPFKTYFWGNLPRAIENKWCKLDQKLKEKEAKQEALEKKWTWKPAQETIISCYIMQKRKCAKYKDIKPVQPSINKRLVEASFGFEHSSWGNKLIQWVTGVKYLESVLVLRLVKQEAAPKQFTWGRFVNTCH